MKILNLFYTFISFLLISSVIGKQQKGSRSPFTIKTTIGGLVSIGIIATSAIYFGISSIQQYDNAAEIPSEIIKQKKELNGKIVSITDGDTYRFRHLPSIFSSERVSDHLKDKTIIIRIAAVDTPETAKFGNPGQAYGNEAKEFATKQLLNTKVTVKCLSRDQYGRIVGTVKYSNSIFGKKDISEELLKEGLAVVYRQGGAQYDGGIEKWNKLENDAKLRRKGIWSKKNVELPSDYKNKIKSQKVPK
jgi:endonuclease YncB( thermonuclease family)